MFRAARAPARPMWHGFRRRRPHLDPSARHRPGLRRAQPARREFFRRRGIEPRPASTGVQGMPFPDAHDFSMRLHAVRSSRPLDVTPMSTPMLNEAWSYGADFSRGLRVAEANKVALTSREPRASTKRGGPSHVGRLRRRRSTACCTTSRRCSPGAGPRFDDLVSGVTYLKRPSDAPALRAVLRQRGFDGFPCALRRGPAVPARAALRERRPWRCFRVARRSGVESQ